VVRDFHQSGARIDNRLGARRDAGVDLCFIIADALAARALWGLITE
jgi:hypothetical protein